MSDLHAKRFTHGDRVLITVGALAALVGGLIILAFLIGAIT